MLRSQMYRACCLADPAHMYSPSPEKQHFFQVVLKMSPYRLHVSNFFFPKPSVLVYEILEPLHRLGISIFAACQDFLCVVNTDNSVCAIHQEMARLKKKQSVIFIARLKKKIPL